MYLVSLYVVLYTRYVLSYAQCSRSKMSTKSSFQFQEQEWIFWKSSFVAETCHFFLWSIGLWKLNLSI